MKKISRHTRRHQNAIYPYRCNRVYLCSRRGFVNPAEPDRLAVGKYRLRIASYHLILSIFRVSLAISRDLSATSRQGRYEASRRRRPCALL
jgi:hypothetical protein